jgi:Peptidase of plants and bacteria
MVAPAETKPDLHPRFATSDNRATIEFDLTNAPDLREWAVSNVAPVLQEWYPKLIELLPSHGFHPAKKIIITFKEPLSAPAYTQGNEISANASYFRTHPNDVGALVHETTHVVQAYHGQNPGWLVEGLDDYIRFYIYEPQTHGADISSRRAPSVHYSDSYRTTANFLNWIVTTRANPSFIVKLNAAMRDGKYSDKTWLKLTGKPVSQLGEEWKQALLNSSQPQP